MAFKVRSGGSAPHTQEATRSHYKTTLMKPEVKLCSLTVASRRLTHQSFSGSDLRKAKNDGGIAQSQSRSQINDGGIAQSQSWSQMNDGGIAQSHSWSQMICVPAFPLTSCMTLGKLSLCATISLFVKWEQ